MAETQTAAPATTPSAEQRAEVRKQKVLSLCRLLANGDYATVKFLNLKLSQAEWNVLVTNNNCTQEQADYCIGLGMIVKNTPSIPKSAPYSRWTGTPVEELGKQFDEKLEKFREENSAVLETLKGAGFDFHPQFRNAAKVGSRKNKRPVLI